MLSFCLPRSHPEYSIYPNTSILLSSSLKIIKIPPDFLLSLVIFNLTGNLSRTQFVFEPTIYLNNFNAYPNYVRPFSSVYPISHPSLIILLLPKAAGMEMKLSDCDACVCWESCSSKMRVGTVMVVAAVRWFFTRAQSTSALEMMHILEPVAFAFIPAYGAHG